MNLTTKFNLGDTVYSLLMSNPYHESKCPVCGGIGQVEFNGKDGSLQKTKCPNPDCHSGIIREYLTPHMIVSEPFQIKSIKYQTTADVWGDAVSQHHEFYYTRPYYEGVSYIPDQLYPSKELAQQACDTHNNKEVTNP